MKLKAIVLSPQREGALSEFLEKFEKLMPSALSTQLLASSEEVRKFYIEEGDPALLFVDLSSGVYGLEKASEFRELFFGIRRLDPGACILMICDTMPEPQELIDWMDRGATGVLNIAFDSEKLSDSIKEMIAVRLKEQRKVPRAPAQHKIQIEMDSLEQAVVSETVNVGYGGFFLNGKIANAKVDDRVEFEFLHSSELAAHQSQTPEDPNVLKMNDDGGMSAEAFLMKGFGRITWIRDRSTEGSPEGVGIEFVDLDEKSREWLHNYVSHRRIKAFIPKN